MRAVMAVVQDEGSDVIEQDEGSDGYRAKWGQ
jgi:hypothetical protein